MGDLRIPQTIYERAIMLDSGPLISLYDSRDNRLDLIEGILLESNLKKYPVIITLLTIAETHNRILHKIGYSAGVKFLDNVYDGSVNIVGITENDIDTAKTIIAKLSDKEISFTDAITMAIMKRMGILKVLSFDKHFYSLNFQILPLSFYGE